VAGEVSESAKDGWEKMFATARLARYRAKEPYHDEPAALLTEQVGNGSRCPVQQVEAELEGHAKVDQALARSSIRVPRSNDSPEGPRPSSPASAPRSSRSTS